MPIEKSAGDLERLLDAIRKVGFPLVGALDLEISQEAFLPHARRYQDWIARGYGGEMEYLRRGLDRRLDPRLVFPETRTVISCAIPYRKKGATGDVGYARYLYGPDYHKHLPTLLEEAIRESGLRFQYKICVDTSAVLERSWAALAGLGWIGKNTLLIHPKFGSYLFLATLFVDLEGGKEPSPLPNYCGHCSACLNACPTQAFQGPGWLDSRKCISYLTLEKRGEWTEEERPLIPKLGKWIAGCDVCQEVCPFNRKPENTAETWPIHERDQTLSQDFDQLWGEDESSYRARIKHSALSRIKFPEMRRNLSALKQHLENGKSEPKNSSE